jgi:hypothetical protein
LHYSPAHRDYPVNRSPTMPALPSSTSEACSTRYEQALNAYQAGHFDAATAAFDQVFALNGTHADGLHLRGLVAGLTDESLRGVLALAARP